MAAYGYGPQASDDVVLQPDVVVIEGGPTAIRAVSTDRMVWSIDAGAGGVADLAVGKVMFASSDALGRILDLERRDGVAVVTLAPVSLTEVVSDAHLVLDQDISIGALQFLEIPDLPGAVADTPSELVDAAGALPSGEPVDEEVIALPAVRLVAGSGLAQAGPQLSTTVGDWNVTAYLGADAIGLRARRTAGKGALEAEIEARIDVNDLRVTANVPISNGVVGTSRFRIDGITGVALGIRAGAGDGLSANRAVKLELPVQLTQRVIIGGFPVTLTQKLKFLLNTAFTARNGNLAAAGSWTVEGPLGFAGSTLITPTLTERDSLIESINGVSIGLNGLVYGVAFEFGLLAGLPVAGAGPVISFITVIGVTNGSDLGIVKCRQSSLTSTLTGGVGISVYEPVKIALKELFGIDLSTPSPLITVTIAQDAWYDPPVVACRP